MSSASRTSTFTVRELGPAHAARIVELVHLLNPKLSAGLLAARLAEQWGADGYHVFGLLDGEGALVGVASAWISVRLYGGRLAELDNVVVDPGVRGRGAGSFFLNEMENWLEARGCRRIELKTYVTNARSHKFYFDHGYSVYAFYFVKEVHGG